MDKIIELRNIIKNFGNTKALKNVDFSIFKGEIHGLVGENGAGKSTLAKIISGDIRPTSGKIFFNNIEVIDLTPVKAAELGVAIVHQYGDLAPNLSIVDNVFLGNELCGFLGVINKREMIRKTENIINKFEIDIDPNVLVEDISPANQQIIAITKALCKESTFLIVDEGGVSLDKAELEDFISILKKLKKDGVSILYISHILDNVLEISDRITVLRDGEFVETVYSEKTTSKELASLIVGKDIQENYSVIEEKTENKKNRLEIHNLSYEDNTEQYSIDVQEGEILGITGPTGAGKSELLRAMMGLLPVTSGKIVIDNEKMDDRTTHKIIKNGVAYIPEDRLSEGLMVHRSVEENTNLASLWKLFKFFLNKNILKNRAVDIIDLLNIKTSSSVEKIHYLSGGNQQKVVVGKWLKSVYKIFLFDEPFKGIDIGAKEDIKKIMKELAENGATIIVVSSEFSDLIGLVERLLVMVNKKIVAELDGSTINNQKIIEYYQSVVKV